MIAPATKPINPPIGNAISGAKIKSINSNIFVIFVSQCVGVLVM